MDIIKSCQSYFSFQ